MIKSFNLLYCILILFSLNKSSSAWIEWDYLTLFSQKILGGVPFDGTNYDKEGRSIANASYQGVWFDPAPMYENANKAPRPRRGHSIVVTGTPSDVTEYAGYTYLIMFGGRDNSKLVEHIPKSYNVEKVNGTMQFTTYDDKPLNPCLDKYNKYYTKEQQAGCKCLKDDLDCIDGTYDEDYGNSEVAVIYNDVWAYRMCDRPVECNVAETNGIPRHGRCFNTPCEDSGWVILHPGALEGGCVIQLGILVCNVPSERYSHSATMFEDGTMYVYGGFSQRCQDFCDDIWMFDLFIKGWRQLYASGTTYDITKLIGDIITINNNPVYVKYTEEEVPVDKISVVPNVDEKAEKIYRLWAGPGKRWRHTMVVGGIFLTEEILATGAILESQRQTMAIFGGHRLWHGYSPENSEKNSWQYADTRPLGGYLDDLWMYTKKLDYITKPGETFKGSEGRWKKIKAKKICYNNPGVSWESRFDISCTITWPTHRAGHGSAFDVNRNLIWIYGGYHTYYPYLSTDSSGSAPGVSQAGTGGFVPYPAYNYFLGDLWYFNITDGYWTEVQYPPEMTSGIPDGRMDMLLLLINKGSDPEERSKNAGADILFMHGGYADNYLYDDTWYYNITSGRWLEKERHTDAIYAESCTDDVDYIKHHPECELADWKLHLERDDIFPFHIKPYVDQDKYWPDPEYTPYWDIIAKGADFDILNDHAKEGTAMWPNAATGPNQYAHKTMQVNATGIVMERCTSVFAEPTRGHLNDGLFGRSNGSIFIPQRRNRRQGWDGCRDRFDGRTDLPQVLQYHIPTPRALHRGVYLPITNEIIIYGGMSYYTPMPKSLSTTYPVYVKDDMWYYNFDHCLENCTGNGDCYFGFCQCYVGYYGEDCSNSSCPGTACFYDEYTHDQVCTHGCQAAYKHTDEDIYVQDISKIPCTREYWGESNGICDGFGTTQCVPPFIGDDCSIKDCKHNCSFNGWCSVEFPVSRCMCQPGYFGDICEHKICLNNCSYPHGVCNITSGQCECRMMYNPYNSTQEYHPWDGEDCSYLPAYSAANYAYIDLKVYYIMILVFSSLFFIDIV